MSVTFSSPQRGKKLRLIEKYVFHISKLMVFAGMAGIIIMMLLVVFDVTLRFLFNRPITGAHEITSYSLAILVFSAVAWAEVEGSHISMPLILNRLPKRGRTLLKAVIDSFSLILVILITWRSIYYAGEQWAKGYVSGVLHIPTFPFIYFVAFGSALYALAIFVRSIKSWEEREK